MAKKLLEINGVSKIFRVGGMLRGKKLVAADDVTLSIDSDRPVILSIVGESGCGKSTLYKMLLRLHNPDMGEIILDGKNYADKKSYAPHQFKLDVQPIFQNPYKKRYTGYYTRRYDRRGLNATYLHYRYMLVSIRRQSYPRYPTIEQRKALAKLDRYSQEARLLVRNRIHTEKELSTYRISLDDRIHELHKERWYLKQDNQDVSKLNEQLKPLYLERRLCIDIVERCGSVTAAVNREKESAMRDVARERGDDLSTTQALQIYETASSHPNTLPKAEDTKHLITYAVNQLNSITETLSSIQNEMLSLASVPPEFPVVMEMFGVGETLGPQLMAEIGDIERFERKQFLVAFAGVDAPPYQSGTFESQKRHISKRGSPRLRKTLFQVMNTILQHAPADDPVYQFLDRKRAEGKHYYVYMTAGANKFLRIYYGTVKAYLRQLDRYLLVWFIFIFVSCLCTPALTACFAVPFSLFHLFYLLFNLGIDISWQV